MTTMTIGKLLPSPVISMLLLPCFSSLLFLLKPLLRILPVQGTTLTWPFNSACFDPHLTLCKQDKSIFDAVIGISKHKHVLEEQLQCIFCMSDFMEGEEIRKLRCNHLFHRRCLDGWLAHRRTTCPLCRRAVVPFEAKEKLEEMKDEEEIEDYALPLLAFVQSEWWRVVHPLG